MSKTVPHIVSVSFEDASNAVLSALEEESVGGVAGSTVTIVIEFGAGEIYRYPRVPVVLAVALKMDPEGVFPTIRYWPGYHRIQ